MSFLDISKPKYVGVKLDLFKFVGNETSKYALTDANGQVVIKLRPTLNRLVGTCYKIISLYPNNNNNTSSTQTICALVIV